MDEQAPNISEPVDTRPPEPEPLIPYGWLRAVLIVPAVLVLVIVVSLGTFVLAGDMSGEEFQSLMTRPIGIVIQFAQMLVFIVPIWLFRKYVDRRSIMSLGLKFDREMRREFVFGLLAGFGLISIVFLVLWSLEAVTIVDISFPAQSLAVMTAIMIMVGFSEEVLFRGYILNNCMDSFNKYAALLITSLAFSVSHLLNPNPSLMGVVNIVLAGLLLGLYYVHRRNLWFPIGVHITWNLFQGSFYGSEVSGATTDSVMTLEVTGSDLVTGGPFGFEASIVTSVVLILAIMSIHLRYRERPPGTV
jgi:membrane protease YdiL (CAAX protease family)